MHHHHTAPPSKLCQNLSILWNFTDTSFTTLPPTAGVHIRLLAGRRKHILIQPCRLGRQQAASCSGHSHVQAGTPLTHTPPLLVASPRFLTWISAAFFPQNLPQLKPSCFFSFSCAFHTPLLPKYTRHYTEWISDRVLTSTSRYFVKLITVPNWPLNSGSKDRL